MAVVGTASLVMVTSDVEAAHTPLLIVQRKALAPTPKPVTPDVGELGVVIVPVPLTNVQAPVPTVAVLPAKVAVVAQTVWLGPALAVVGV